MSKGNKSVATTAPAAPETAAPQQATEPAAPQQTGYKAEYPGRQFMRAVPRNVKPDALYELAKPYAPRVPECKAAYDAVLAVLKANGGKATGWELHKACQGLDNPFFGFRVNAGTFRLAK